MKLTRQFSEFVSTLNSDISTEEMYASLSSWMTSHRSSFDKSNPYAAIALELSEIDITEYYINSDIRPDIEIQQLRKFIPSSDISLTMIIRDLLWSVVSKRVEYLRNDGVNSNGQLLWSPATHAVFVEDLEGALLTGNLNPVEGKIINPLRPASKRQIDAFLADPKTTPSMHLY